MVQQKRAFKLFREQSP